MFDLLKLRIQYSFDRALIRLRHWFFWWPWLREKLATKEIRELEMLHKAMSEDELKRFINARGRGRSALLKIYLEKYGIGGS